VLVEVVQQSVVTPLKVKLGYRLPGECWAIVLLVSWLAFYCRLLIHGGAYPALVHRLAIRLFWVSWCKMACSQLFMPCPGELWVTVYLDTIEKANTTYCQTLCKVV
jgi:hypothetical protein